MLGPEAVETYLRQFKIRTIVRGHQHNQSLSLLTGWQKDVTATPKWTTQNKGIGRWEDARKALTLDGDGGDPPTPKNRGNYDMATFFSYMPAWGERAGPDPPREAGKPLSQFVRPRRTSSRALRRQEPHSRRRSLPLVITTSSSTWSCNPRNELGAWAPAITFTTKLKSEVDKRDAEAEIARQGSSPYSRRRRWTRVERGEGNVES